MKTNILVATAVEIMVLIFLVSNLWGGTTVNAPLGWGGRAVGMGGVGVASVKDVSAMVYNPALITCIKGGRLDLGLGFLLPKRIFSNKWNSGEASVEHWYLVPQSGYVQNLNGLPFALGVGLFFTYGAGTDYEFVSPYFDNPKKAKSILGIMKFTPTLAWQLHPKLSVGAAFDINYGLCKFRTPFGPAFIDFDKEAEGWGLGYTLGLIYRPVKKLSIGLSYTSESNLKDLESDRVFFELSPRLPVNMGGGSRWIYRKGKIIDMQEPCNLSLGIAYEINKRFTIAFDARWRNYSDVLKRLKVELSDGNGPNQTIQVPLNWDDLFAFGFGFEYCLNDKFSIRAGYQHDSETAPPSNLLPIIPTVGEADIMTFGIGYMWKTLEIDLAWAHHFKKHEKTEISAFPIAPGPNEYNNSKLEYGCDYWVATISKHF